MRFADRTEAGRVLGEEVARHVHDRPLVLALPRGGAPVAAQVASATGGDLDIVVARKIGAPKQPEFGVGAIAEDGPPVFDELSLRHIGLTAADLAPTVERERAELRRRVERYRGTRPAPRVTGREVVVVDDGLATGVTAHAALRWVREHGPARLLLAVPVCSVEARDAMADLTDLVVYLAAPKRFRSVGEWYDDFRQLTDADVDHVTSAR